MSFIYRRVAPTLFPSVLWHTNGPVVCLSFDDGPHPSATPRVLDILRSRRLKATFFLLGDNVARYPELTKEIDAQGHSIGNHAFSHQSMIFKSSSWQTHELKETNAIISQTIGNAPRCFRPPFGLFNFGTLKAAKTHGLRTILWDVDSHDYAGRAVSTVIRRVCMQTVPGSIILFHDNSATSEILNEYLNPILDNLQKRNLIFSTIPL